MKNPRVRTVRGQDLKLTHLRSRSPVAASLKKVEEPFGGVKVMLAEFTENPTRVNAFSRTPRSMQNHRPLSGPKVKTSLALPLSKHSIDSPTASGSGRMIQKSSIMQNKFPKSQQHQNYQHYLSKQRVEQNIDESIL